MFHAQDVAQFVPDRGQQIDLAAYRPVGKRQERVVIGGGAVSLVRVKWGK